VTIRGQSKLEVAIMNHSESAVSMALLLAMPFMALTTRDQQDKEPVKEKAKVVRIQSGCGEIDLSDIHLPPIELDLSELENSLKELESSLRDLDGMYSSDLAFHIPDLPNIEIPEINISPLEIAIPPFSVEIPPIPPIELPKIAFGDLTVECDIAAHKVFHNLSDEEQIRLQALRSLACQGADQAITAYQQVQKQTASPAMRYEAIRQLGRFLEDGRVLTLVADAAKTEKSIQVRKKAIALLGKSRDPQATKILEEILLN
jgi:hypothetical protein